MTIIECLNRSEDKIAFIMAVKAREKQLGAKIKGIVLRPAKSPCPHFNELTGMFRGHHLVPREEGK
jgi:hypothetical protein